MSAQRGDSVRPADDRRAALAEALRGRADLDTELAEEIATRIAPVVDRLCRDSAAAALRDAAEAWVRGQGCAYEDWQAHEFLRDRAEALDADQARPS